MDANLLILLAILIVAGIVCVVMTFRATAVKKLRLVIIILEHDLARATDREPWEVDDVIKRECMNNELV